MTASPAQEQVGPEPIRRMCLPANVQGRDFVVGDLHGCLEPLRHALEKVDFHDQRDRLIAVGDLVDRGPDSPGCLRLLDEPWFHCVIGNHEAAMLAHAGTDFMGGNPEAARRHMAIGGAWLDDLWPWSDRPELRRLMAKAAELPHIIQVGEGEDRYHVVHAQLPLGMMGRTWTDRRLDRDWARLDPVTLIWARRLFTVNSTGLLRPHQRGLSPVFCGHTPAEDVRTRLSHVCLDTGLVYGWLGEWEQSLITLAEPGREGIGYHRFSVACGRWLGRVDAPGGAWTQ